jgi:hypothetical protein
MLGRRLPWTQVQLEQIPNRGGSEQNSMFDAPAKLELLHQSLGAKAHKLLDRLGKSWSKCFPSAGAKSGFIPEEVVRLAYPLYHP